MNYKSYLLFIFAFFALFLIGCDKSTTSILTITTESETTIQPTTTTVTTEITTKSPVYFTVTFMQDDLVLKEETVLEGKGATAPTNTEKMSTLAFTYSFNGWDKDFSNVESDLIVNAIYIETAILYDVTFYDYDSLTVIETIKAPYNASVTPPEDIETRTDEIYTYTFDTWIGDYSNITGDTYIYSSYTRTYTTTGDYSHTDFYNLVSSTFDITNEENIENNISYLTEIFEAETEEEAYRVFNILKFNYDQLTLFSNFMEFQEIFSNLESGFLTDERLVNILFNYLKSDNSYFVGLSDLEYSWYNEVLLNYNDFQDQYDIIKSEQALIEENLNQEILLLDEVLRLDASNYFYEKVNFYAVEKEKFSYFNYLKTYISNDAYDINTAIWNILDKDNIDPLLYDFYLNQYNSLKKTHYLYIDKIENYYPIMENYYNANITYAEANNIVSSNTAYESFIVEANSCYSSYIQSINNYFLIKDDIEYWELQFNGIKAASRYHDLAREIFNNTSNEELYKEALLIIINDIQNTILSASDAYLVDLPNLITFIINNQDMYGYLDTHNFFEYQSKEGFFDVFRGISDLLDLRYLNITPEESEILDNALHQLVSDYTFALDINELDLEQTIQSNYEIAKDYFNHLDNMINQIQIILNSITINEVEQFEVLVNNQDSYSNNEYTIELAKLINTISQDNVTTINSLLDSFMYINFFQVDVHIDFSLLDQTTQEVILRMEGFLNEAEYISVTDPTLISQTVLDNFYNEFNDLYHDFLFSYSFYLDN